MWRNFSKLSIVNFCRPYLYAHNVTAEKSIKYKQSKTAMCRMFGMEMPMLYEFLFCHHFQRLEFERPRICYLIRTAFHCYVSFKHFAFSQPYLLLLLSLIAFWLALYKARK